MTNLFKKGNKFGKGRPKGTPNKDTTNYLDAQLFAKIIWEGAEKAQLTGKEMIELGFRGLNALLPKIPNLPGSPSDSVKNAESAAEVLKELERPAEKVDVDG